MGSHRSHFPWNGVPASVDGEFDGRDFSESAGFNVFLPVVELRARQACSCGSVLTIGWSKVSELHPGREGVK
jgi:hypothetical protein